MTSYESDQMAGTDGITISGDIVGGVIIAVLGLMHLFLLGIGGMAGLMLLFFVWPIIGGAVAAYYDFAQRPERSRDLAITGGVSGVFAAVAVGVVVFLTGYFGSWTGFITDTFGVGLVTTTIGLSMLLIITWTVSAYVAGYFVRRGIS